MKSLRAEINCIYGELDGDSDAMEYDRRHGVESLGILTIASCEKADTFVETVADHIRDKIVVEIGAGVGLLALAMARVARHVYAIEVDPAWTWAFTKHLYKHKPVNLTWIFGRAQDMVGILKADIAVVFTNSDIRGLLSQASLFAPKVIHSTGSLERIGIFYS